MQLKFTKAVLMMVLISGCSRTADVVRETPPFLNTICQYSDLNSLEAEARKLAHSSGLELAVQVANSEIGAFSLLFWKKDFNIVVSGIPESKKLYFTALKRGDVTPSDKHLTTTILKKLPMSC